MKSKLIVMFLVIGLLAFGMVGCGDTPAEEVPEETPQGEGDEGAVEEGSMKLGLGVVTSIAESRDADPAAVITAQAQADVVMASVLFDGEGKVVSVTIDNAQSRVAFDEAMQVVTDISEPGKTKKDLGPDYNMASVSEIGREWFEQMDAFEEWMIGKTVEEITGLEVKASDDEHQHVPAVPELESLVTITVEDYIAAVAYAYENGIEVENAVTAGLGSEVSMANSVGLDAANEVDPMAQIDTVMAAVAFDAEGKVVGVQIDNAQIRINFDGEGKVASDKSVAPQTKVQLGDDYGMRQFSEIEKEWFEQIASLEEWMVGKSVDEINSMPVKEIDEEYQNVPDVPELTSSVTITVENYLAVVTEAYGKAE